jgi:hypothetical protein
MLILLRNHLKNTTGSRQLSIWIEIENFKNLQNIQNQERFTTAQQIYHKYLHAPLTDDPFEGYHISVPSSVLQDVRKKIDENRITSDLFDPVQAQAFRVLLRVYLPTFVESDEYTSKSHFPSNQKKKKFGNSFEISPFKLDPFLFPSLSFFPLLSPLWSFSFSFAFELFSSFFFFVILLLFLLFLF